MSEAEAEFEEAVKKRFIEYIRSIPACGKCGSPSPTGYPQEPEIHHKAICWAYICNNCANILYESLKGKI